MLQSTPQTRLPKLGRKYLRHTPLLAAAVIAYGVVCYILTQVEPRSIQNIVIPNTYLPLLAAAAVGHFCLGSFVFLNTRRGALSAVTLTLLLFLQLQHVLTNPIGTGILMTAAIVEIILTFTERAA